jgi:hypothetical protein
MLAGEVKGTVLSLELTCPDRASFEIVEHVRSAPDMIMAQNRDVALRDHLARLLIRLGSIRGKNHSACGDHHTIFSDGYTALRIFNVSVCASRTDRPKRLILCMQAEHRRE